MAAGPDIECPVCGVEARLRCRTLTTGRTTDTHTKRYDALYERMAEKRAAFHKAQQAGHPSAQTKPKPHLRLAPLPEVCSCGNRFDGDNLCMISACQEET